MQSLLKLLDKIDGQGYKAYKSIQGEYRFPTFRLVIDHVQGDPFAEPSRCRIFLPISSTDLPEQLYNNNIRRIALEDFLGRRFASMIEAMTRGRRESGHSGIFDMVCYGQQVLQRNALLINPPEIEVRFQIGLPDDDRRVGSNQARIMFGMELPVLVESALLQAWEVMTQVEQHVNCVEDQQFLRDQLDGHELVAFIANGSMLARHSGIDDRPLLDSVRIKAPDAFACVLSRKHAASVKGIAITRGVNLIVGGGFHGKSTLLRAIEQGVYNHIPGDGRELVVSDPYCCKIRAEDGRSIVGTDILPFIHNLPGSQPCAFFSTNNASGSSSEAASTIEALATGAKTLLFDEDSSASNFLLRDERMRALVPSDKEPITPLIQCVRQLWEEQGISIVLVAGGSGEYFSVADKVIMMDNYQPQNVTVAAKLLAGEKVKPEFACAHIGQKSLRFPNTDCLSPLTSNKKVRIKVFGTRMMQYGDEEVSLIAIEQLVDSAQALAIGHLIGNYHRYITEKKQNLVGGLNQVYKRLQQEGFDVITPYPTGKLAMPRFQELVQVVNRMRLLALENLARFN